MSIVNLQRDGLFLQIDTSLTSWSEATAIIADQATATVNPTVMDDYAASYSFRDSLPALTANEQSASGILIRQPGEDIAPYRVKAYSNAENSTLIVGYLSGTIGDGVNRIITPAHAIPFQHHMDELIMILPVPAGDPNEDKPLCFAISVEGIAGQEEPGEASLSVQRLATSPPQFSQSVS